MHLNWSCVPRASQHHTVLSFCSIRNRFPRTAQVQRYRKNNPAIPHNPTSSNLHISERPFFLLLHVVKSTPLCQTLFSSWAEVILWYFLADLTSTICYNLVRAKWPHHLPGFEFSELSKDQVRALRKKWEFFSSRFPGENQSPDSFSPLKYSDWCGIKFINLCTCRRWWVLPFPPWWVPFPFLFWFWGTWKTDAASGK